mgnify:CR=1 FL=1
MKMVDREEILKIATLSKLFVSEEELPKLTTDMEQMIAFADTINNAEDASTDFDNINNLCNVLREDEVVPSLDRDKILGNAKDIDCLLYTSPSPRDS